MFVVVVVAGLLLLTYQIIFSESLLIIDWCIVSVEMTTHYLLVLFHNAIFNRYNIIIIHTDTVHESNINIFLSNYLLTWLINVFSSRCWFWNLKLAMVLTPFNSFGAIVFFRERAPPIRVQIHRKKTNEKHNDDDKRQCRWQ